MSDKHCVKLENHSENEEILCCPTCGMDYVHPVGLACISPGKTGGIVSIDHRGVVMHPDHPPFCRGVRIVMTFICEGGCLFQHAFQFHKGQTMVETIPSDEPGTNQVVIWRS